MKTAVYADQCLGEISRSEKKKKKATLLSWAFFLSSITQFTDSSLRKKKLVELHSGKKGRGKKNSERERISPSQRKLMVSEKKKKWDKTFARPKADCQVRSVS